MDEPFPPTAAPALADALSAALTGWLEQMPPQVRTAFLLREGFDAGYAEIARATGLCEEVCRALVEFAAARVRNGHPSISSTPQE
jgi:DNA-directed RNA polymerase specialized sigma24 family protein